MTRHVSAPPAIRPALAEDAEGIRAVLAAAYPSEAEADLVDRLREDPAWVGEYSLVAVADAGEPDAGAVIGFVLLTRIGVGTGQGVALAPLAVRPADQHRRVGSALVEAVLEAAHAAGEELVVVLGEPAFYSRFGFRPAAELAVTGPFGDVPQFQALPLPPGRHGRDILTLPAGEARYPAPFAGL